MIGLSSVIQQLLISAITHSLLHNISTYLRLVAVIPGVARDSAPLTQTHTHTYRVTHTLIQTRELNSANDFNGFNGLYRLPFWKAPFWN
jgi:hypothetical protein